MLIPIITILVISAITTWAFFSFSTFRRRRNGFDEVAELQRMVNLPRPGIPDIWTIQRNVRERCVYRRETAEAKLKRELEGNASVVGRALLSWRELEEEEEQEVAREIRHVHADQLVDRLLNVTKEEKEDQAAQAVAALLNGEERRPRPEIVLERSPQIQMAMDAIEHLTRGR